MDGEEVTSSSSNSSFFISPLSYGSYSTEALRNELPSIDPVFELVFNGDLKGTKLRLEGLDKQFISGIKDKAGWSLLHYAVLLKHVSLIEYFIKELGLDPDLPSNVNSLRARQWRPIHIAAELGYSRIILKLKELGANIEMFVKQVACHLKKTKDNQWNPLHLAVQKGSYQSVMTLLNLKAYVDPRSSDRTTPLMIACAMSQAEIVTILLKSGADPNAQQEKTFKTPLLFAAERCCPKIIDELLKAGADPTIRDSSTGLFPLVVALCCNDSPPMLTDEVLKSVQLKLLDATLKANPEALSWTCRLDVPKSSTSNSGNTSVKTKIKDGTPFIAAFVRANGPCKLDILRSLLLRGADINTKFSTESITNMNLLHFMLDQDSFSPDLELLDFLLENGIDVNHANSLSLTPLIIATQKNLVSSVQKLILSKNPPNVNIRDIHGGTALMYSVKQRRPKMVQLLLELKPDLELGLDFSDKKGNHYSGCTPLQMAVGKNSQEIVALLLDNGANICAAMDAIGPDEEECCVTCLHSAVVMNFIQLGIFLIDRGLDPNVVTSTRHTPLDFAASWGHLEFGQLLIERGATVNPPFDSPCTPLIYAAKRNKDDIIKLLLSHGADPNRQDKQGYTALHWALNFSHYESINALLLCTGEVSTAADGTTTLPYKLNVNFVSGSVQHRTNVTPLVLAIEYCMTSVVGKLLQLGADPNAEFTANEMLLTPIFLCAEFDYVDKALLLLKYGANIDMQSSRGETPLHFAIRFRKSRAAEMLIKQGANLELRASIANGEMLQPMHIASQLGQDDIIELLINYGASINSSMVLRAVERVTPLHVACLNDLLSTAAILVRLGCEVNCTRSDTFTPLLTLVSKSNVCGVKLLLENGADVNCRCVVNRSRDATCLHMAAQVGCLKVVQLLIEYGADLTARMTTGDRTGIVPLLLAAESGHLDVIRLFLENGIDPNTSEDCGLTCLHYAANSGKTQLVKYLLKAGANVKLAANFDDGSRLNVLPIHMAAEKGHDEAVRLLIAEGSPLNSTISRNNRDDITPLYLAVSEKRLSCVSALVDAACDVNQPDNIGVAPLHIATQRGYFSIFKVLLTAPDLDVNITSNNGITPLHLAAEKGHTEMAFWLLRMGADLDPQCLIVDRFTQITSHDITPLNQACGFGHEDMTRLLIKAGCNLYCPEVFQGEEGIVSIHCAAIRGRSDILPILIDSGVDINYKDNVGRTALHWAVIKGFYDFVARLLAYGADPTIVSEAPRIVLLKEGTDTSQGVPQVVSNINACQAVSDAVRTTLGPRGMDKLIIDDKKKATISNDGATILKLLDVVHPAAKTLVDIARSQDAEVGDGTTSVTLLAGEFLRQVKPFIEEGVHPQVVIRAFRKATQLALKRINELSAKIEKTNPEERRDLLVKCAATALSSKLVALQKDFFAILVVDAVSLLDDLLPLDMIGIKKVSGGGLEESKLIAGVAFKKTFSYAGFEMQPKSYKSPTIALLNIELELKAEKENAEIRVNSVEEYQNIVDAEWSILYDKLDTIVQTGAKIVLSKLPIGDVATQYFADRDMFCAGRVTDIDLKRTQKACGGSIQTTVQGMSQSDLGKCEVFEEIQIGSDRYNIFKGCPQAKTCTIILRGGAEQFIEETERSLHDAIMIVRRAMKNDAIVAGGGAIEMELSKYLRNYSRTIAGKEQLLIGAMARAYEIIPRQLCENAGFDATNILNKLRQQHAADNVWSGVDILNEDIADNMAACIWEPALVKSNAIVAASEAACLILSVDETIKNPKSKTPEDNRPVKMPGRGRGRPMM